MTDFEAPGPGLWQRELTHQVRPMSRYQAELFFPHFDSALRGAFRRYGILLDRIETRQIRGWGYTRPRPVGAPEKPGRLPPAPIFKLLLRLHPELRRRTRAAARAVERRSWREAAERWHRGLRRSFLERVRALQRVDPTGLDDLRLRRHLDELVALYGEGAEIHFGNLVASLIAVGDFLAFAARNMGTAPDRALAALSGGIRSSRAAVELLEPVVEAVAASPEAREALATSGAPAELLERLRRSSGEVSAAIDAYLEEHGLELATGFDLDDRTVSELPGTITAALTARMGTFAPSPRSPEPDGPEPDGPEERAARLRSTVPEEERAEFNRLFEDARELYRLREDDVRVTVMRTMGLIRRALLEAGRRLVERGSLDRPEHLFEADPSEAASLLLGEGGAPSRAELAARARDRSESAHMPPPPTLGEPEAPPPPLEWLPEPLARVNGAMLLALSLDNPEVGGGSDAPGTPPDAEPDMASGPAPTRSLTGIGASGGRYRGTARIVREPSDFHAIAPGDVLVASTTSPAYNVLLPLIGAVVTDRGGALSHAAIVAREFGIPAVVGTGSATSAVRDGALILVDGDRGVVELA